MTTLTTTTTTILIFVAEMHATVNECLRVSLSVFTPKLEEKQRFADVQWGKIFFFEIRKKRFSGKIRKKRKKIDFIKNLKSQVFCIDKILLEMIT